MAGETYGVIEAQRRFRAWMPQLTTHGQSSVYGAMLGFFSIDGTATPTVPQLAALVRMHPESVRKILRQLETIGALMRVGDRPVQSADGVARGGRVPVWSIPNQASEGLPGMESQPSREPIPTKPRKHPNQASEGLPLNVERLKEAESLDPKTCPHVPVDSDGYCTACKTEVAS